MRNTHYINIKYIITFCIYLLFKIIKNTGENENYTEACGATIYEESIRVNSRI